LASWNQLASSDIQEGQTLFVSQPNFSNQENSVATTGWQQTNSASNQNFDAANNQVFTTAANNPIGNFNQVAGNQNNINTNNQNVNVQAAETAGYHVVKPNENIYEIAARYKVQVSDLRKWNQLEIGSNIKPGDRLIVDQNQVGTNNNANMFNQAATEGTNNTNNSLLAPAVENTNNNTTGNTGSNFLQPATDSNTINQPAGNAVYHTVKPNENLFSISKIYGVQVSQIKRLSNKTNNQVSVGDRLRIR